MRRYLRALMFLCAALAATATVRAQEITTTIAGTITDQTGAALPGVTVTARDVGKGVATEMVTSKTGRYTLPYLTNGEYDITCTVVVTVADCSTSTGNFGKLTGSRARREIQLGVKFFWN